MHRRGDAAQQVVAIFAQTSTRPGAPTIIVKANGRKRGDIPQGDVGCSGGNF